MFDEFEDEGRIRRSPLADGMCGFDNAGVLDKEAEVFNALDLDALQRGDALMVGFSDAQESSVLFLDLG